MAIGASSNDNDRREVEIYDWNGAAWVQVGSDISGEAQGDLSGWAVDLSGDGETVAIGAYLNSSGDGHVRVYDWNGASWTQKGSDLDAEASLDCFGYSVGLSGGGDTLVVGAPLNNGNGTNSGHIRLFYWNGGSWSQIGSDIDGEASNDEFGTIVSISKDGTRIVAGAPKNDDGGTKAGHLRIFDLDGNQLYQTGDDIDGEAGYDQSGIHGNLSGDGSRVAVGAPFNDDGGNKAGHARVFDISALQLGNDLEGDSSGDEFGSGGCVSGSGSRMASGARGGKGSKGYVRAFNWTGSAWSQMGSDFDGDAAGDSTGYSVGMNHVGDRLCIGSAGANSNRGRVRVYSWNGSSWSQMGSDIDGEATGDRSGCSVDMDSVGSRIVIGAHGNSGNGSNSGHARVCDWNGSSWVQVGSDIDGESAGDRCGRRVTINALGDYIALGAENNSGNGANSGHVRIFRYIGAMWSQMGSDIDGEETSGNLGESVRLNRRGNRLVCGAPGRHSGSGQADVYDWSGSSWNRRSSIRPASSRFGSRTRFGRRGQRLVTCAPRANSSRGRSRCFQLPPCPPNRNGGGGGGAGGGGGDTQDPVAATQNINAYLDASGNVSIIPGDVDNGSTDNVGITSYSLDVQDFNCSNLGGNTVTLTVEDAAGNSDDETAIVTVIDTIAPARTLNNFTLNLDGAGSGTLTQGDVVSGISDACDASVTTTLSNTSFNCDSIGVRNVRVTVTDDEGNSRSGLVQVTVADDTDPVLTCQTDINQNNDVGVCGASIAFSSSATDNCTASPTFTYKIGATPITSPHIFDFGTTTVDVTAEDDEGNTVSCSFDVTVNSFNGVPAPADLLAIGDASLISGVNYELTPAVNWKAGAVWYQNTVHLGYDFDMSFTNNFGSIDATGGDGMAFVLQQLNTSSLSAGNGIGYGGISPSVAIEIDATDNGAGQGEFGGNLEHVAITANGEVNHNVLANTLTSPVLVGNLEDGLNHTSQITWDASAQTLQIVIDGTHTISYTGDIVTNIFGGNPVVYFGWTSSTGLYNNSQKVEFGNLEFVEGPTVDLASSSSLVETACGADTASIDISVSGGVTPYTYAWTSANFGATVTSEDLTNLAPGEYSVTVTDQCGSSIEETFTINRIDNTDPTVVTKNATLYLNGNGSGSATLSTGDIDDGSSDDCGAIQSMNLSKTAYGCADLGNNSVTLTVNDTSGNSNTGNATLTVLDTLAPNRTLNNFTLILDGSGNGTLLAANVTSGVSDNCASTPTITLGQTSFDCDDIASSPMTVSVTASDGNGNSRGGTVQVTVEDNAAPAVTRNNTTLYLDGSGSATLSAGDVTSGISDNCTASPGVALGQSAFDCDDLGANSVSVNVTDGHSNANNGSVTVTVEDTVAPVRTLNNVTVYLDASGNASIASGDVSSAVSDNCDATPSIALSNTSFDCDSLGNRNVRVTISDDEGNSRSGVVQVTVIDTIAPTYTANNYNLYLDASGNGTLTTGNVTSAVNDNCDSSPTIDLSNTSFDCDSIGVQNVRINVTDASGNKRSALVQVTVADTIALTRTLNNHTVYLDASGAGSIVSGDVVSAISDACDASVSVVLSNDTFDCDSVGVQSVRVTVTDDHGNSRSGLVQVAVEDTIAPTHTLNNSTVYLDANGSGTLSAAAVSSSVSDACDPSPSVTLSNASFDCDSVGNRDVRVTTTDLHGNSRSGIVTITIADTIAPTFDTTHATLVLSTVTGQVTLTIGDVTTNVFDACDIDPSITLSKSLFDCGDIGLNTVTVTVTDKYGNNRSADVPVTIEHHPVVNADFEIVRDTACVVTVYNTSTQYNHLTWNWGDGSSTHTRAVDTVQHTYTDINDFIITLTAYDTCDYTSTHADTVRIWPYVHNNTRDTSCSNEPFTVIDADCISIAKIEWEKNGSVFNDEHPAQQNQGTVCAGGNDGGARNTQFRSNAGIALNPTNGNVLVVDKFNHRVMSWSCGGASGVRIAGALSPSGNPLPGSKNDQLRYPQDVWADAAGNVYVADMGNDRIMKYTPGSTTGVVVAGGGTGIGSLKSPTGVVVDNSNGDIYVADQGNHRIVRYTSTDTTVVAGVTGVSGSGLTNLNKPWDIILDDGDMIIAEYGNHRVVRWTPGAPSGTVIAGGNGYGRTDRHLAGPKGVSINRYDELFVVDYHNDRIMKWPAGASVGEKVAGNNGTGAALDQVLHPEGVITDDMGRVWISDTRNHRVMKWDVDPVALTDSTMNTANYTVTLELEDGRTITVDSTIYFMQDTYTKANFTFTTNGLDLDVVNTSDDDTTWTWSWGNGDSALVKHPGTYTYSQPGTYQVCLTVTDSCSNSDTICQYVTVTAPTSTLAAGPQANPCDEATLTVSGPNPANVLRVEYYKDGVLMTQGATGIDTIGVTVAGGNGGGSALNQFKNARRVYVDALGNVFVTEKDNNRVTMWAPGATSGVVVAGGSRGSGPEQLSWPMGITMDANGDLLIADTYNNRVQKVSIGSLTATTIAGGSNGSGIGQLNRPSSVAVDASGNIYISDENNHRIVRYSSTDTVVVAGTGTAGSDLNQLRKPSDIKIAGNYFYVADRENHRVIRWPLTATSGDNGTVVAGGNGYGSGDDELKHPESIGVDASGAVYISDYGNNRLQIWLPGDSVGSTEVGGVAAGRGNAAYQLHNPEGLFIAADGSMYCVDRGNNRVQKYGAQGSASQFSRTTTGTGTYHAVVFYTDGTSQTTNSVNVTVDVADAGAWTYTTSGLQLTITSASPVGSSYTWYFGDGNSSTSMTPVHTYAADSTYSVCLVAMDDCGNTDSTCMDVTVSTPPPPSVTGPVNENSNAGQNGMDNDLAAGIAEAIIWDVYPNPTDGIVNLHASQEGATVELMDIRGQVISTWIMEGRDMQIDLSDKAQGTYMIRMILEKDIHMERIILDR